MLVLVASNNINEVSVRKNSKFQYTYYSLKHSNRLNYYIFEKMFYRIVNILITAKLPKSNFEHTQVYPFTRKFSKHFIEPIQSRMYNVLSREPINKLL